MDTNIAQLVLPIISIAAGLIVGIVVEKVIMAKLGRLADKTKWEGDNVVIEALRGMTVLWFLCAGIYVAILRIPLSTDIVTLLRKILLVVIISSVTVVLARVASGIVSLISGRVKGAFPSASIFANLTKLLIFIVGILVILQSLGVAITPLITALGIGGLAVALALQDTLSNFFAGLHILFSRQVRPGDYVKLDTGEEGYVTDITWRNTAIKAIQNNMIIVPNAKLASAITINFNLPKKEMAVRVEVGVSYDSDLEKVEKVTIDVAKEVMREVHGGISEFEPFIWYHNFGNSSIDFTVIMRTREFFDQYRIRHEFIKRLHSRFRDEGIEIPFPITTVYMKKD